MKGVETIETKTLALAEKQYQTVSNFNAGYWQWGKVNIKQNEQ